ncbi:hypothetical protein SAMN05877809_103320 [Rhodobacter sp. JA431]|uniref:oxidoreductase n=1 Tax=Rhodobacter sp. JA431 TaxID=570013 RepID=UPI000BC8048C|nr:oxidoreductase [Rhodobacter sp. JA431]SOC04845.1 hypothetical protein SAMN05877809_103320 [Rhodobacter sp. JA431]
MRSLKIWAFTIAFVCLLVGTGMGLPLPATVARAQTALPQDIGSDAALAPLMQPQGPVLLTVQGALAVSNAMASSVGDAPPLRQARFDDQMLAEMPRNSFSTSTIWTSGVIEFEGVDLLTLMNRLGVTDGRLRIRAINDYIAEIPVDELRPGSPLLADRRDGQPMSIREKGPLWLVYPYDSMPEYRNEVAYARSVWQVDRIEVLP